MAGRGNPNWKPGKSGNPNCRPKKGNTITELIIEIGEKRKEGSDKTLEQLAVEKMWELAIAGDVIAFKYLSDRKDGSPTATVHNLIENLPDVVEVE